MSDESVNEWIIPSVLKEVINEKANDLSEFILENGRTAGIKEAEKRLMRWAENFRDLLPDLSVLTNLIREIRMIRDQSIVDRCITYMEKNSTDDSRTYYCAFGDNNESSSRIMRTLNCKKRFKCNLPEALDLILAEKKEKPVLWFIDDFINSGGQFKRIIEQWFTDYKLSEEQRNTLMKCETHFFFELGKEEGRTAAEKTLGKYKLNGNVHVIEQYDDLNGCFGNSNDVELIAHRKNIPLAAGVFYGKKACEITDLFNICQTVGEQLSRLNEPGWDDDKLKNRSLGYGNSARLILNQNNIPTCTLTCLWRGGSIEIKGRNIIWEPLFNRRKKHTAAESPVTMPPRCHEKDSAERTALYLDSDTKSDAPLEVIIAGDMKCPEMLFRKLPLCDMKLDQYYDNGNLEHLIGDADSSLIIRSIGTDIISRFNNHLVWCSGKDRTKVCKVKIVSVHVLKTPWSLAYSIRLKIYSCGTVLNDALELLHLSLIDRTDGEDKHYFYQKHRAKNTSDVKYSARSLVNEILSQSLPGAEISRQSPRIMAFIRIDKKCYQHNSEETMKHFAIASSFHKPKTSYKTAEMAKLYFEMNFDAYVSVNERGTMMFCGSGPGVNAGSLQNEFASVYYFNEMIRLFLKKYETFSRLKPGRDTDKLLYDYMADFMKKNWINNIHAKKHLELLNNL